MPDLDLTSDGRRKRKWAGSFELFNGLHVTLHRAPHTTDADVARATEAVIRSDKINADRQAASAEAVREKAIVAAAKAGANEEAYSRCKTLEAAILHRQNWARLKPEMAPIVHAILSAILPLPDPAALPDRASGGDVEEREAVAAAIADLENVRRQVFGSIAGDEPNLFEDYDRAVAVEQMMMGAISVLRALPLSPAPAAQGDVETAVLKEREACLQCALRADEQDEMNNGAAASGGAALAADAIRARTPPASDPRAKEPDHADG